MVGSAIDEEDAAIRWVDKYCIDMNHISTHTSISTTSSGDENWEKEFSLLVAQEEKEAPIGVQDDLRDAPLPSQQQHRNILLPLDTIHPHMDAIGRYITEMKIVGDKKINFYNNFFVVTDIVLTHAQPQIFNLHPLDTFHTHAHELHSDFFVLE